MKHLAAPTALLLLVTPELALASAPAAKANEATGQTRVICKIQHQLGTRTRKLKSCGTAQEWEDLHGQIKQHMDKIQNRHATDPQGSVIRPGGF